LPTREREGKEGSGVGNLKGGGGAKRIKQGQRGEMFSNQKLCRDERLDLRKKCWEAQGRRGALGGGVEKERMGGRGNRGSPQHVARRAAKIMLFGKRGLAVGAKREDGVEEKKRGGETNGAKVRRGEANAPGGYGKGGRLGDFGKEGYGYGNQGRRMGEKELARSVELC